jgi:colicin import membrane protein
MSNTENSALIALSELKNLEANRVADIESAKKAKEDAERRAREEAERRAREEAERVAKAEAERLARLAAEQEARDREERLRLQEADLRARAEQEARLKEEQMRLDAQVKLAEKKAKPVWLFAVLGLLVVGLGIGGWQFYEYTERQAEQARVEKAAQDKKDAEQKAAMAALMGELKGLKDEQTRLEKEKQDLDNRLNNVTDAAEKQRLLAEKAALDAQIADNASKQTKKRGQTGGKTDGETKPEKSKGGITVKKNVDDPLDGL